MVLRLFGGIGIGGGILVLVVGFIPGFAAAPAVPAATVLQLAPAALTAILSGTLLLGFAEALDLLWRIANNGAVQGAGGGAQEARREGQPSSSADEPTFEADEPISSNLDTAYGKVVYTLGGQTFPTREAAERTREGIGPSSSDASGPKSGNA